MISFSDILTPNHVNLAMTATDQQGGVEEVLSSLNGDPRVQDWNALKLAITERNAPAISCGACGVCIAHGRTNSVQSLVMAAGRSSAGLGSPQISEPVQLVFVAGIPGAFQSEYLRIVGAIARLCHDKDLFQQLLSIQDPAAFVAILATGEAKL